MHFQHSAEFEADNSMPKNSIGMTNLYTKYLMLRHYRDGAHLIAKMASSARLRGKC